MFNLALVHLHRELAGTDARILLQVHDSILVQAPRESAQAVRKLGPEFPVAVDTNISPRWGQK